MNDEPDSPVDPHEQGPHDPVTPPLPDGVVAGSCVVVGGVSGSGKTTVGRAVADELTWAFLEGDELHPAANVEKMRQGIPLTDEDRRPWLDAVGAHVRGQVAAGRSLVVACSALRRAYRDQLRDDTDGVVEIAFVQLDVPEDVLRHRVETRHHAYMPASLLPSQLAALEPPGPDERDVLFLHDRGGAPEDTAAEILHWLSARGVSR